MRLLIYFRGGQVLKKVLIKRKNEGIDNPKTLTTHCLFITLLALIYFIFF